MSTPVVQERTYGNFKPARRRLIAGLGPGGLLVCFVIALVAFLVLAAGYLNAAVVVLVAGAVIVVPMAWEVAGLTLADRVMRRVLVGIGVQRRQHVYRSGVVSPLRGTCRLPGIAWSSRVMDVETGRAGWPAVGIVILPGPPPLYAVTLRCDPSGTTLVDRSTVDSWIAAHGDWLQRLGAEPDLVQAQVTVETAPDLGADLAEAVAATRDVNAPAVADQVMTEIVQTYPRAAAWAETRVTLVFSAPRPRRPRDGGGPIRRVSHEEMCLRIAGRLPQIAAQLRRAGAGLASPMSAGDLAAACRVAYDPAAARDLAAAPNTVVWSDCGPVAARESWDHYQHDSGVSVTWGTSESPRSLLYDTALPMLMRPESSLLRKRVTVLYRPMSPAQTAKAVDADVRDSKFRAGRKRRPNARDHRDVMAAQATAQEEATGAGLVRWSVLYTATVRSVDDLDTAEDTIRDLGAVTRLQLRRMDGSQSSAFAGGLPIGIVLSRMSHIKG